MTLSRLATLKKTKDFLAHGLKHHFKDLEDRAVSMINLIMEVSQGSPLPPTNKQYLPEMFFAQMYARDLIQDLPLLLMKEGRFEDMYRITNDPSALGGCIAWGMNTAYDSPLYDDLKALLKKSLELGGVLSSNFAVNMSSLRDPRQARGSYNLPPVDQVKMLVTNQLKNEWAIEPEAPNSHRYGEYMAFLIAYICDNDPQWGLRFLLENEDRLSEIIDPNFYGPKSPHLKSIAGCIPATLTAKLLSELNRVVPEFYDELMGTRFIDSLLINAVEKSPEFKVSDLPAHENLLKPFLTSVFSQCAGSNTLTQDRLEDLNQAWDKVAQKGALARESFKSENFKYLNSVMSEYNALIRTPDLTAEKLIEQSREFPGVGSHWLFLDALRNKPGSRITDDPQVHANHLAFRLVSSTTDLEFIENLPVKAITLGVIALELKGLGSDENEDQALLKLLRTAFENKEHHAEVAKLSKQAVESAMDAMPDFDKKQLRKINWMDRSIKASMLEEDLGM